ncbi:endonuclease domain-containing 1 protein-like [Brachyhypopomus gauderio]|uniref:endonuclease domain-containing 1 protein-like n=1 Tax=Brachyhypopomus gauderio TaxID=698409 RepID=UPI004041B077
MLVLITPVVLLLAVSGCFGEVVDSFNQTCPEFFANPAGKVSPPTIFADSNYKQICQIRENAYEYATFYDTTSKIPVYSAYKFVGFMNCTRSESWYIEPQLDNRENKRMSSDERMGTLQHQAVNADYKNQKKPKYDRGHLAPVLHAVSQGCSNATFTLTNAAPQLASFNRGQWRVLEKNVARKLNGICSGNSAYIVTGVVPGDCKDKLNARVCIPSHFWSAYCCLDNNLRVKASCGFLGQNQNVPVISMSVTDLENNLINLYNQGDFYIFDGHCRENQICP